MNKICIFAVTLFCLLFVDLTSSIRVSHLSARLAVRQRQLQVEDAEARETQEQLSSSSSKSSETVLVAQSSSSKSLGADLTARITLAIDQLHAAELQVATLLREAKHRAEEETVKRVKEAIDIQIAIMKREENEKEKAELAVRAAERVLSDPATLVEIALALEKRIEGEIIRAAHEERVEKQVTKELQSDLIREAEKAHNETIRAQAAAAKNVAKAMKDVQDQYSKAEKAEQEVARQLKEGVKEAIYSAANKYEKLISTPPPTKVDAPAAPVASAAPAAPQPGLKK